MTSDRLHAMSDLPGNRIECFLFAAADHDSSALAGKDLRDGFPDAAAGTGYDSHLVLEDSHESRLLALRSPESRGIAGIGKPERFHNKSRSCVTLMRPILHGPPNAIIRSRAIPRDLGDPLIPAIPMTHDDTSEFIIWNIQHPAFILVVFLAIGMIAQSPSV